MVSLYCHKLCLNNDTVLISRPCGCPTVLTALHPTQPRPSHQFCPGGLCARFYFSKWVTWIMYCCSGVWSRKSCSFQQVGGWRESINYCQLCRLPHLFKSLSGQQNLHSLRGWRKFRPVYWRSSKGCVMIHWAGSWLLQWEMPSWALPFSEEKFLC